MVHQLRTWKDARSDEQSNKEATDATANVCKVVHVWQQARGERDKGGDTPPEALFAWALVVLPIGEQIRQVDADPAWCR